MQHYIKVLCSSAFLFFAPLVETAFEKAGADENVAKAMSPNVADTKPKNTAKFSGVGEDNNTSQGSPSETSIGIPGLGSVGVIPNLDFGMEFLYGQENKHSEEPTSEADDASLQIRGTVKHRF